MGTRARIAESRAKDPGHVMKSQRRAMFVRNYLLYVSYFTIVNATMCYAPI